MSKLRDLLPTFWVGEIPEDFSGTALVMVSNFTINETELYMCQIKRGSIVKMLFLSSEFGTR